VKALLKIYGTEGSHQNFYGTERIYFSSIVMSYK